MGNFSHEKARKSAGMAAAAPDREARGWIRILHGSSVQKNYFFI
jgi:hypothetical protein